MSPPTPPPGFSAGFGSAGVWLEWGRSQDNVAVTRYVVVRDGAEIGATAGTTFADPGAGVGQHTYAVHAEDAAGNRSPASASRIVTVPAPSGPVDRGEGGGGGGNRPDGKGGSGGGRDGVSREKPALRWKRRPNGAYALEVNATRNPDVARVSLMLNGLRLRSSEGRVLRMTWRPPAGSCARSYRFSAQAFAPTKGGHAVVTTRVRYLRLAASARCRGRKP